MQNSFRLAEGHPYPLGVNREEPGIHVSMRAGGKNCGILFFDEKKEQIGKVELSGASRMGELCYAEILWEGAQPSFYQLYEDDKIIFDTHMKSYEGHEKFGMAIEPKQLFGKLNVAAYDWEEDTCPRLTYEDSVMYCMHVRGFTRHTSSGVQKKGTFQGICEKLSYLQELGITTLELMPVYELQEKQGEKLNYWGYQEGLYYALRNAYAFCKSADVEFKNFVKELHRRKMEVVLQFYFPKSVSHSEIFEILRYWRMEYHVDGFHLKGEELPLLLLGQEPGLADTKLFYYDFPLDRLYPGKEEIAYRNLASYRDDFMYDMRCFLKGDEDMLGKVTGYMRNQPAKEGQINYFTNYYGFTLADMVSYERKNNLENGEENRDGNDYNHTWNCGVEGKSRKKAVVSLRQKQMRNALCMLFFSQGTPLLFMGDEFGNSQNGNNNPYCQDNEISWLNWKRLAANKELYEYVKALIALRKAHPILHKEKQMRLMDYISCGYPDLSYHATKAWQPDMHNYSRHIGLMYCGKYARRTKTTEDDFFYVAMNMHWEPHEFALPKLPKGYRWYLLTDTKEWEITDSDKRVLENQQICRVDARSIQIYISKKEKESGPCIL